MDNKVEITMGKLYVASSPTVLATSGIGSCIAICLFAQSSKQGALAHAMLPKRPTVDTEIGESDLRYVDIAIEIMVRELGEAGVQQNCLVAKIVGGANMFPGIQSRSEKMGQRNVDAVKLTLKEKNIPVAAEVTGGSTGRAVTFDLTTGIVTVQMTI